MKTLDHIRSEGYVAGEHGAPLDHNPYSKGSAEWCAWNCGWSEADVDYRVVESDHGGGFIEFLSWVIMLVIVGGAFACIYKAVTWLFDTFA